MAYKYHSINDFIKVIRVMHKKSITLEEIIYDPAGEEDKEAHQQRINYLIDDIRAHAQQLLHG